MTTAGVRSSLLGAVVYLSVTVTAGCTSDPFERYCDEVRDQQEPLSETIAEGGPTDLLEALPIFLELREKAPDDISDEWATVTGRLTDLANALDDAGIEPSEYDADAEDPDVGEADRAAIRAGVEGITSPAFVEALNGVQQQARDVCKTPLAF